MSLPDLLTFIFLGFPPLVGLLCGGCCCGTQCTKCSNDPDVATQMQIEVSGVVAGTGSCGATCSTVDGVYVADFTGEVSVECAWRAPTIPCYSHLDLQLFSPGINVFGGDFFDYKIGATFAHSTNQIFWLIFGTDKPDCDFEALDLPNKNNPASKRCDFSSATVTVTAV